MNKKIKRGSQVQAKTVRGTEYISGKVVEIRTGLKGDWIEIKPTDKTLANFSTRAAFVSLI